MGGNGAGMGISGIAALDRFAQAVAGRADVIGPDQAQMLANEHYGLSVRAEPLSGERDENMRLVTSTGAQYLLKISSPAEDAAAIDLSTAALLHVKAVDPQFPCPRIICDRTGQPIVRAKATDGSKRTVRLFTWLDGTLLRHSTRSSAQRIACGHITARLNRALRDFTHPAANRPLLWDMRNFGQMQILLSALPDFPFRSDIADIQMMLEDMILPVFPSLRHQVVHNDLNKRNVLVDADDETKVSGVIDFEDMVYTALIADVAIAADAQITAAVTAETEVREFLAAYRQSAELFSHELTIVNWLIAARIVMDMVTPAWYRLQNPDTVHYAPIDAPQVRNRLEIVRALCATRFF
jgi:hydroxylysine kinase